MNRTKLKNYAPQARRDFIQTMTDRAANFGLTAKKTEPLTEKGDVAVIGGRSFPVAVARKRKALEDRIKRHGFEQTMEAMAYTWFNRLVAIRFMELHGYLEHGYRVLSHPEGKPTPEILEHAEHVELPGLRKEAVIDLKLAGNKEGELYRLLLTAQCNALHKAMPFLFERIDDETELLLPDNFLNSDSLMRKLVGEIDEEDWNEVEIIGWLYQFYISEKKDEVIGKVVASEDIPAATQLFTPNWIVKYLVQNTLGRQWMEHYPESPLKAKMEYYIEPAEQTEEVQEQLKEMVRQRAWRNRNLTTDCTDVTDLGNTDAAGLFAPSLSSVVDLSLNPENLTLLDPACGSGHILVEAYDLFKAIYLERGYRARDIPALILEKNLFGMEIDDRAAQLAAFALMMKARADDRRIFDSEAKPNILAFEDSQGMNDNEIYFALTSPLKGEKEDELKLPAPEGHLFEPDDNLFTRAEAAKAAASRTPTTVNFSQGDIAALLELFENAKTFGSLIQVPPKLAAILPVIEKRLDDVLTFGDLTHASAHVLKPILQQAQLLSRRFHTVVANPPYMGGKHMNAIMKQLALNVYPTSKTDVCAMFIVRSQLFCKNPGSLGFVVPYVWMFISSYQAFRESLITSTAITSLIQLEYNAFEPACVPACAMTLFNGGHLGYQGDFIRLSDFKGHMNQSPRTLEAIRHPDCGWRYKACSSQFTVIPGAPIAYWIQGLDNFRSGKVGDRAISGGRCKTHNDEKHVRFHWEVARNSKRWKLYLKGGGFRKFYGNESHVVDWSEQARSEYDSHGGLSDSRFWSQRGITWSLITSSTTSFRLKQSSAEYSSGSPTIFCRTFEYDFPLFAFLNSKVAAYYLKALNPTLNTTINDVFTLPFKELSSTNAETVVRNVEECVALSQRDWDSCEISYDFKVPPVLQHLSSTLQHSQIAASQECLTRFDRMKALEEESNCLYIKEYGLQDELSPDVPDDQITLYRPDVEEDMKRLVCYALGCMMGRYSLDTPGLIYAEHGNQGFDASQYKSFRADHDGIIPLLETDWGIRDDAANRIVEFVSVAWPKEHLEENLKFIADSLGPNSSEQPRETIRRFLASGFYKHHLPMYKKRPIYWLFSSGKQRAFQCLVYLHRYHEGTLARMRTEYVIPLQGQIAARIEQLEGDKAKATSTSHRKKLQKEQDDLKKQQTELLTFEEKLKHAADQQISLDLDDGVKVNYAKFGDLLAESKAICGAKDDD